jgi:hypothetical protein
MFTILLIFDRGRSNMSLVSEIKCPNCGKWSTWTGKVDDTCAACGKHLEPQLFLRESERKLAAANNKEDYFVVKESDETITQLFKIFMNPLKWGSFYVALLFFILVAGVLMIFGLLAAV